MATRESKLTERAAELAGMGGDKLPGYCAALLEEVISRMGTVMLKQHSDSEEILRELKRGLTVWSGEETPLEITGTVVLRNEDPISVWIDSAQLPLPVSTGLDSVGHPPLKVGIAHDSLVSVVVTNDGTVYPAVPVRHVR